MNIKKDYIDKTKDYLIALRLKLTKREMLNDEIDILEERESLNSGYEYGEGLSTGVSYRGIEDLIISYDAQITSKKAQIDKIDFSVRMYELYSRELNDTEKEILDLRYLKNKHKLSFEKISNDLKYSRSNIARIHDEAIEKLAYYVFGEEATYV